MESTKSANAADREALRAIEASIARLQRIVSSYEFHPPPSGYGPDVDAVVRKAAANWVLSEISKVEARLAVLKRLQAARLAQVLSAMGNSPSGR
jgi:hypothetical protein